jgi:hypothetical protein
MFHFEEKKHQKSDTNQKHTQRDFPVAAHDPPILKHLFQNVNRDFQTEMGAGLEKRESAEYI